MTMAEAVRWLRIDGRNRDVWLRRYLLSKEKVLGHAILLRSGSNPARPRYRVSMSNLRRYAPELVDVTSDIAKTMKALVNHHKYGFDRIDDRFDELEGQVAAAVEGIRQINQLLRAKVADGSGRLRTAAAPKG